MDETTFCRPEDLERVLLDDLERHVEDQRRMLTRGLGYIKSRVKADAPRFRGDFAESVEEYVGEPGVTWHRNGGSRNSSVEATMQGWRAGQEVGIATDAPYSRKLIFHAGEDKGRVTRRNRRSRSVATGARRTYTKKVGAGWVEKIVDEGNRRMESE